MVVHRFLLTGLILVVSSGHQFLYSARREGQIENSEKITGSSRCRGGVAIQGQQATARGISDHSDL